MEMRVPFRLLSLSPLLVGFILTAALADAPTTRPADNPLAPDPKYSAEEVVKIQLQALQHNDQPAADNGVAVAFRFASPANQKLTGPLDRFIKMVKTPTYAPLVNSKSIDFGDIHNDDSAAQQLVHVTTPDGQDAFYIFILHKQTDGQFQNCWMTDGVVRVEPTQPPGVQPAPPPQPQPSGDGLDKV
jgi:Domain of unknown function (DUF4864)